MHRPAQTSHSKMFPDELEQRCPSIYRPKPIIRLVPLTNGILYNDNRRQINSCYERGYSDRFTSTSTSSPCDTDTELGNGTAYHCNECHGHANQRCRPNTGRNRYSLPRMGYFPIISNAGDTKAPTAMPAMSRGSQLRRRRRSRTVGCVFFYVFGFQSK